MAARVRTTDPQRSCSGKEVAKHRLEKSPNDKLRNDDKRVPQPADTHLRAREVSDSNPKPYGTSVSVTKHYTG
ncbi:hypothetical protein TNCV_1830111 [Trichonephila clavipes]|nr:hypothetical protein TNCV_1830111 [Trichonephila clavipes]